MNFTLIDVCMTLLLVTEELEEPKMLEKILDKVFEASKWDPSDILLRDKTGIIQYNTTVISLFTIGRVNSCTLAFNFD